MKNLNRRELCVALSALAAMSGEFSNANAEGMADPGDADLGGSRVIAYDQLPVHKNTNGGESRQVMSGVVKTGEYLEIHETMLPAEAEVPHHRTITPTPRFSSSRPGNLEYINDGKPEYVGPGGIIFTASNVMHGLKNVGTTPATYIVVSIGAGYHTRRERRCLNNGHNRKTVILSAAVRVVLRTAESKDLRLFWFCRCCKLVSPSRWVGYRS